MRQTKDKNFIPYISFFISIVVMFFFLFDIYGHDSGTYIGWKSWIYTNNVRIYACSLLIFVLLFLISSRLMAFAENQWNRKRKILQEDCKRGDIFEKDLPGWGQVLIVSVIVLTGFYHFVQWGLEGQWREIGVTNGGFYNFPMVLRVLMTLICFIWVAYTMIRNQDVYKSTLFVVYAAALVSTFMTIFILNPWSCIYGNISSSYFMDIFDNTSITETVYNVLDGTPYTYATSGLYGHYALFFLPFLKLFGGGDILHVMLLLGVFGCLAQLATIYIIHTFCPTNWLKGMLSLAAVIRTSYTYPAISPIRTLFPLLLCAYMVFLYKRDIMVSWKGKWIWLGYLISAGGVLWNTETGIGCIIGFSAYILVVQWQKESPLSKVSFLSYLLVACAALLSMLFPVGIVNLYNFACGMSNPVFRVFFYPYISGSWATESLRCNVPLGNHAWIYILMLLLGCLAWGMYHTRLLRGNSETFIQEAPVLAGMSTTGLIVFAYYINEAHWGCMDIVHQIAVCLSAVILAKLWFVMTRYSSYGLFHHQIQRAVVLLAVMIYSILAIQIADDPVRIAARNKAGAYTLAQVNEDIKILLEEIPVNTYGVGQSVNILYHEIGWSNHARFRDTTSIGLIDEHGSYNKLLQEILKQDSFLIASQNPVDKKLKTDILAHDPSYVLQKQICINGHIFSYMVRDQSSMSD